MLLTPDRVSLMMYRWGLRVPRILISVTGGAMSFDLPPQVDRSIRAGLRNAAVASKAWFITGGSNSGVMKYVGEALVDGKGQSITPIIGVASWGVLNGRDLMEKANGGYVDYGNPDKYAKPHVSLDRNHTHFILVDDGSANQFGVEV